jgi:hypothetical protein
VVTILVTILTIMSFCGHQNDKSIMTTRSDKATKHKTPDDRAPPSGSATSVKVKVIKEQSAFE